MAYLGETTVLPAVCLSVCPAHPFPGAFSSHCEGSAGVPPHAAEHTNQSSTDEVLQWVGSSCGSNEVLPSPCWELFKERPGNLWVTWPSTAFLGYDTSTHQSALPELFSGDFL